MVGNWNNEEKREIARAFGVLATIQKSYGNKLDIKTTLQAWEVVLSGYSAELIVQALELWVKRDSSMPTPADIIKLINPLTPKITTAEFVHAQKQHELEGFPMHGYYGGVIKDYLAQQGEGRDKTPLEIEQARQAPAMDKALKQRLDRALEDKT